MRGWGTALFSISLYGWIVGPKKKNFYLLSGITSLFTSYAHVLTILEHKKMPVFDNISMAPMYVNLGLTLSFFGLSTAAYFDMKNKRD